MKVSLFLWKTVCLLIILVGIVGIITIANWHSSPPTYFYEYDFMSDIAPFGGYITCIMIILIGFITLGGVFWWNRYPTIDISYGLALLIGLASIIGCHMANNDNALKVTLSMLGMFIVILTILTFLIEKYSSRNISRPRKIVTILSVLTLCLVLIIGFVFPQCFDTVARSFPDIDLREIVRNEAGKPFGFITQSDLEHKPTEIMVWRQSWEKQLTQLDGLEKCTGLEWLALGGNDRIADITPLSALANLEYLQISFYYTLSDLTPLSNLNQLTELNLHSDAITDISPISNLVNLNMLNISSNNIKDISPLSHLVNLSRLDISSNNISDISPLLDNTGLGVGDVIYLGNNPLDDYSTHTVVPELTSRHVSIHYWYDD